MFTYGDFAPTADFELLSRATAAAGELGLPFRAGNILTADAFYSAVEDAYRPWVEHGVLCVEMETAGLYSIAARYGISALSILTISDSLPRGERSTADQREHSFSDMVSLALHCI